MKVKVCVLGAFAVGKTSLVQQFVNSIFSEKYLTTLGVKIDSKKININGMKMDMVLWDLAGEDEFMEVRPSYLRGSAAVILVADGTRDETLDIALKLKALVKDELGDIPNILLINKSDILRQWTIDKKRIKELNTDDMKVMLTSAKDANNVENAFLYLAEKIQQTQG